MRRSVRALIPILLLTLGLPQIAEAVIAIDRFERDGSTVRIEGQGAVPNSTITLDGTPRTSADGKGKYRIEFNGFSPLPSCEITVSDSFNFDTAPVPNCTPAPPPNSAPTANAGADQSVDEGALVFLDGTASSDPDNDPLTFSWTQTGGPPVTLTGAETSQPSFTAPAVSAITTLTFQLTVSDSQASDIDAVIVTVSPLGVPPPPPPPLQSTTLGDIQKLVAGDAVLGDSSSFDVTFGMSVAVSGEWAVVGVTGDNGAGARAGAAYFFQRNVSGQWVQRQKVTSPNSSDNGQFGFSVAMSGSTAVVGENLGNSANGLDTGTAHIYQLAGGSWTREATVSGSDITTQRFFGNAVAACGDTVIVGAPLDPVTGQQFGDAYVFRRGAGGGWTEEAHLVASDRTLIDQFGSAVSCDGNRAVISSPKDDDLGTNTGSVYIFERSGTTWTEITKLNAIDPNDTSQDNFGRSVAVKGDLIAVGATGVSGPAGVGSGRAYAYRRDAAGVWNLEGILTASDELCCADYGISVAVETGPAGDFVVVGARTHETYGGGAIIGPCCGPSGSAYVYTFNGAAWQELHKLVPNLDADDNLHLDNFGESVSISAENIIVGAPFHDRFAPTCCNEGAVYAFDLTSPQPALTADFTAGPTSGDAPLTVNFQDTSTGTPYMWQWDFGDGGTARSRNPSHRYDIAGTYDVSLTVTNLDGSNTRTKVGMITVTEPPGTLHTAILGGGGATANGTGVTTSNPAGINCTAVSSGNVTGTCTFDFPSGTIVTLIATPDPGSVFVGFNGPEGLGGDPDCADGSLLMNINKVCFPTYMLQQFALTVNKAGTGTGGVTSNPAGIDCGPGCLTGTADYDHGTTVTLTATPELGSSFAGWSAGCLGGVVTVDADKSCTATFTVQPAQILTVTKAGGGSGTVRSNPAGIDCGADCSEPYTFGLEVVLTATPGVGSVFSGFTGPADCADGRITLGGGVTCTATFDPGLPQTLTVEKVEQGGTGTVTDDLGGINCGLDCTENYPIHTVVTLTADPDPGSRFAGWTGVCTGTGVCTVTMDQARLARATFSAELVPGPDLTLDGEPFIEVLEGETFTLNATVTNPVNGTNPVTGLTLELTLEGVGLSLVSGNPVEPVPNLPAGGTHVQSYLIQANTQGFPSVRVILFRDGAIADVARRDVVVTVPQPPPPNFTLTVTKAGNGGGTITSNPAGINCGADCSESYPDRTEVILTPTPDPGSTFDGWSGDVTCFGGTVLMNADKTCTATFNLQTFVLTVNTAGTGTGTVTSSPPGINCGLDCVEAYVSGTTVGLTAAADPGSTFVGFTGDAGCAGGTITMDLAKTCTATFDLAAPQTLTVNKAGLGAGTVTSSPAGISCGTDCTEQYGQGTVVTLTATADGGSTFAGFSGIGCETGIVTMDVSRACTATFNPVPLHTLSVTKAGTGTGTVTSDPGGINCGATCSADYEEGIVVTLTASPGADSVFSGFSGAGCTGGSVTMDAARSCTVTFDLAPPPPPPGPDVSVALSGPPSASRGQTFQITATVTNGALASDLSASLSWSPGQRARFEGSSATQSVAAASTATVSWTLRADKEGPVTFTATVTNSSGTVNEQGTFQMTIIK